MPCSVIGSSAISTRIPMAMAAWLNVLLASGGYPWTVVRVEDRAEYLRALDRASIDLDARPFAAFIAERVTWSVKKTNLPAGE